MIVPPPGVRVQCTVLKGGLATVQYVLYTVYYTVLYSTVL